MAVSIEQLEGYLLQEDLRYAIDDDRIWVSFSADDYVEPRTGRKAIAIGIRVLDGGGQVEVRAPGLYFAKDAKHLRALCELCLSLGGRYRALRFELDRTDGEVAVSRHFLPAEGVITRHVFINTLRWLANLIDFWHPVFQLALATGELPTLDRLGENPDMARMIAQAGGMDQFVKMIREQMAEDAGNGDCTADASAAAAGPATRGWMTWVAGIFLA